ncbi:MAG: hypothetical protein F6K42_01740 [Leptolyngbya sp. SIO1D8]|nr:hypothetical protein [Leptolyngbya sp. SIO1D8]
MKFSMNSLIWSLLIAGIGGSIGLWATQNYFPALMEPSRANNPLAGNQLKDDNLTDRRLSSESRFEITLREALAIAEMTINGQSYSIEQDIEDDAPVIEVALAKYEVVVDGQSGQVLLVEDLEAKGDPEDIAEFTEALDLIPHAAISLLEAIEIAETFAEQSANSAELENETGNLIYEVIFGLQKIYVDAGNGQILHTKILKYETDEDATPLNSSVQLPDAD